MLDCLNARTRPHSPEEVVEERTSLGSINCYERSNSHAVSDCHDLACSRGSLNIIESKFNECGNAQNRGGVESCCW